MGVAKFAHSVCSATRLPLSRHSAACRRLQAGRCRVARRYYTVVASRAGAHFLSYLALCSPSSRGTTFFAITVASRGLEAQSSRLRDDAILVVFAAVAICAATLE